MVVLPTVDGAQGGRRIVRSGCRVAIALPMLRGVAQLCMDRHDRRSGLNSMGRQWLGPRFVSHNAVHRMLVGSLVSCMKGDDVHRICVCVRGDGCMWDGVEKREVVLCLFRAGSTPASANGKLDGAVGAVQCSAVQYSEAKQTQKAKRRRRCVLGVEGRRWHSGGPVRAKWYIKERRRE